MVPEGWITNTLAALSNKISDGIHTTPEYSINTEFFFVNGNNIKDGRLAVTSSTKCVSEQEYLRHRKELGNRTLLLSINGTIGNVAFYSGQQVVLGKSAAFINLKEDVSREFIYYFLTSDEAQKYFVSELTGTTIKNLSLKSIKLVFVPTPPLPEQQKIAEILGTWDKAIETTEALLANARTQKRALMQSLLTGTRRFPGFEDHPWREVRLGDVCEIRKGEQKSKSTLGSGGQFPVINGGISPSGYSDEWNTEAGTITISEGGNSCGFANLIEVPFWSGGHCYTLENLRVNRDYLFHWLKFQEAEIMRLRVGSGLPNIQKKAIASFSVSVPSAGEQVKIAAAISCILDEEVSIDTDLNHLRNEKKSLMQQLLTGKRRVAV